MINRALLALLLASISAFGQFNAGSAAIVQNGDIETVTDAGGDDTYVGCPPFFTGTATAYPAYKSGMRVLLIPTTTNTGAASVDVCGKGVVAIKNSSGADAANGSLATGVPNILTHDGTNFRITSATISPVFSGVTTMNGLVNGGTTIFTSSTEQTLTAGSTIQPDATFIRINSASAITLTAAPTIAAGATPNQILYIFNFSTFPITFQDSATLAGSTLALQTSTVTLQPRAVLTLHFAGGLWRQGVSGRMLTGTTVPATCIIGDTFTKTDAVDGQNLYACTATNTYKLQGGVTSISANPGVTVDSPTGVVTIGTDTAIVPRYSITAGAPSGACTDGLDYNVDVTGDILYFCSGSVWVQANSEAAGTIPVTTAMLKGNNAGSAAAATPGVDFAAASHAHSAADVTSGTLDLNRGGSNQTTWTASRCVQVNSAGTALESAAAACGSGGGGAKSAFAGRVGAAVSTNTTSYTSLGGSSAWSGTTPVVTWMATSSGTFGRASVYISSAQPASGALTCTLVVNGSDTSVVLTVPLSSSANQGFTDNTNTASVTAGQTVYWKCVNAATTANSAIVATLGVELTF
jgi:hypothetical protein